MIEVTHEELTAIEHALLDQSLRDDGKKHSTYLDGYHMNVEYQYRNGVLEYTLTGAPGDLKKKIGRGYQRVGNKSTCGPFRLVAAKEKEQEQEPEAPVEEKKEEKAEKPAPARRGRPKKK